MNGSPSFSDLTAYIAVVGGFIVAISWMFRGDIHEEVSRYWKKHEDDRPKLRHPTRGKIKSPRN